MRSLSGSQFARIFVVSLVYLLALGVIGFGAFIATFLLVNPHGSLLPEAAAPVVLLLMLAVTIVLPILIARWIWRRM